MNDSDQNLNAEYSQIRELLVGSEKRELEGVRERLGEIETIYKRIQHRLEELDESKQWIDRRVRTIEQGEDFVNQNLPGALVKRNQSPEDRQVFIEALSEDVELCLNHSVREDRVKVAKTIAPAVDLILESRNQGSSFRQRLQRSSLGPAVRKAPWLLWATPLVLALILSGVLAYSVFGNMRWNRAIDALQQEAGIEVIDARHPFFGKPTVTGLRDPKATDPASLLESHEINVNHADIRFAEYHSLNTAFAEERKAEEEQRFNDLRIEFIDRFGDMVEAVSKVRRDDLETMTQAVFRIRFPEAAKTSGIYLEDDQWFLKGNLEEPLFSQVINKLPELVLTGEVDTERLLNSSEKRLGEVREEIEATTFIFLSGDDELSEDGLRQRTRIISLLKEHEKLVNDLGVPGAGFEVHALPIVGSGEGNRQMEALRIKTVEKILKSSGIPDDKILKGIHDTEKQEGRVGVYIHVIEDTPQSSED